MFSDLSKINNCGINYTKDGKCSNCGSCCSRYLFLSAKERKEIVRYCKKHSESMDFPIFGLAINLNGRILAICPFRDQVHKRCLIYPVRPFICKQFLCNDFVAAQKTKNMLLKRYFETDMFDLVEEIIQ